VMNRRGDVAVSWIQRQLSAEADLWSSFREAGAARWSRAPVTEEWYGLQARIALDEVGNATAVWAGSMTISASFKPLGKPWQDDYLLSDFDSPAAQPAVTTHAPENATGVWVQARATDDRVQSVSYDVETSAKEAEEEEDEEGDEEEGDEEAFGAPGERGETFRGTPLADTLVGTPGNDVFFGYAGNDVIDGRGGRDVVYGGPGNDRIRGGDGSDRLFGGAGRDRIIGGRGNDVLRGGSGRDILSGRSGKDIFFGLGGNDRIYGCGGRDVIHGGFGDDRIMGGPGADRLFGGAGDDLISGGRASDVLAGDQGRDVLRGNSGDDTLRAHDLRRDWAFGGAGLDQYRLDRWLDRARSIESRL
jgi:Ca2+-binding RTX toxin-like protein